MTSNDTSSCINFLHEGFSGLFLATSVYQTLEDLCTYIDRCFNPEHLAFLLVEPTTGDLTFFLVHGAKKSLLAGKKIRKGSGVAGWVAEQGQALFIKDTATDPRFTTYFKSTKTQDVKTLMAVPLKSGDLVYGVLEVFGCRPGHYYTEDNFRNFSAVSDLASTAIERAYYFQVMQRMSETDQVTGLSNRRVFDKYLEREIESCKRYGVPCSVMLVVVENLHASEENGINAAEIIVKSLATIISDTMRKVDTVCRIEENKFAVLMPNTNTREAQGVRQRLDIKIKQQALLRQLPQFCISTKVHTATTEDITPLLGIMVRSPVKAQNFHSLTNLATNIAEVLHEEKKFLERRQFYRKSVQLVGTVINKETGVSADILLENLSLNGVGFVTVFKSFLGKNDLVRVEFSLNDDRKTGIRRQAQVRYVKGRYIGCKFTDQKSYDGDLGFYLMR